MLEEEGQGMAMECHGEGEGEMNFTSIRPSLRQLENPTGFLVIYIA